MPCKHEGRMIFPSQPLSRPCSKQALEKALLVFHTNKMAEINKVVKELWQKTYRNRDIDCIQIKADADGAKSYAYRVVMQAGGAELEMRGRCSAGQKVFSSFSTFKENTLSSNV